MVSTWFSINQESRSHDQLYYPSSLCTCHFPVSTTFNNQPDSESAAQPASPLPQPSTSVRPDMSQHTGQCEMRARSTEARAAERPKGSVVPVPRGGDGRNKNPPIKSIHKLFNDASPIITHKEPCINHWINLYYLLTMEFNR